MFNEANQVRTTDGALQTWGDVAQQAGRRLNATLQDLQRRRTLFVVDDMRGALEALAFGRSNQLDIGIIPRDRLSPDIRSVISQSGACIFDLASSRLEDASIKSPPVAGRIAILTSGTTGTPKLVSHTWETVNTLSRVRHSAQRTWFAPYQVGTYAWFQMICLGMFQPDQHLVFADHDDLVAGFDNALRIGIDAVSSTPTFWRFMLLYIDPDLLRTARLKTISMGGEIVDQVILDRLAALFPNAAIKHIYASSEAGAAIVVTDRLAGFPRSLLNDESALVGLRIEGDRLFVRSPFSSTSARAKGEGWVDTGDVVEIVDDRVLFRGRAANRVINVGGIKAYPAEIEAQLLRHPKVEWAQVYARRAPLVGNLPSARIVLSKRRERDPNRVTEAELSAFARTSLPSHAVPRFWEFLDDIPLKPSLKS